MLMLHEAAAAIDGRATGVGRFTSVGSDSRAIVPGQLFVALRGEHFDGHDFVAAALDAGAAAALVDEEWAAAHPHEGLPLLIADDTRLALGRLAAAWRARFDIAVIGVTGSNGKTTVKDMCASILRAHFGDDAVLATAGNLNNDIGQPLTLLALRDHHRAAVIEMGMNSPGEIAYLTRIASPTVAIVNNAQRAHLLGMGSVAEVAREKGTLYDGLGSEGVAVINADDPHAAYWRELNSARHTLEFALGEGAAVCGRCEQHGLGCHLHLRAPQGECSVALQVPGEHNARNAVGAAAACLAAGVPLSAVAAGLAAYAGTRGRLQLRAGIAGATILDDSYNANPDSVRAGIDVLAATPGRKILVLGDMGEIGETSAQVHDEIGGYAKSKGVDALYALGEMSAVAARNFGDGGAHFTSVDALVGALVGELDGDTVVLVKGSRFMRMERIADRLAPPDAGATREGTDHAA